MPRTPLSDASTSASVMPPGTLRRCKASELLQSPSGGVSPSVRRRRRSKTPEPPQLCVQPPAFSRQAGHETPTQSASGTRTPIRGSSCPATPIPEMQRESAAIPGAPFSNPSTRAAGMLSKATESLSPSGGVSPSVRRRRRSKTPERLEACAQPPPPCCQASNEVLRMPEATKQEPSEMQSRTQCNAWSASPQETVSQPAASSAQSVQSCNVKHEALDSHMHVESQASETAIYDAMSVMETWKDICSPQSVMSVESSWSFV